MVLHAFEQKPFYNLNYFKDTATHIESEHRKKKFETDSQNYR